MASNKNQDIVELIVKGEDEYSAVSEEVKQELGKLAAEAASTRKQIVELDRALDLTETYKKQEAEVNRLARAQAEARHEVDRLKEANKEAKGENIEVTASLAKATAEYGSLRTATNRAQKDLDKTAESVRKYGVSMDEVTANQSGMRKEADGLAATLTTLSKKQGELVDASIEQVQATKEQEQATAQANAEAEKAIQVKQAQAEAERKAAVEQQRVKEETERLTQEITGQITALKNGDITWEDYKRSVADAGKASDLTGKQVAEINRSVEGQVLAAKKSAQASKEQAAETARVKQATASYRVEIAKLVEAYKNRKINGKQFETAEAELRGKLKLTEQQVKSTRTGMNAYTSEIKQIPKSHAKASSSTDSLTKVTRRLAQAYTVLLAAQKASRFVTGNVQAYGAEEDAMLKLAKVTDLTANSMTGLVAELTEMAGKTTKTSVEGLLNIAEAAGRMGIVGEENILKFVKSTDALSSATGMAAEEVAKSVAQMLNVTGEAQSNVGGVSAAIATLGNVTATTEDQILHFSKRLAADTQGYGITSDQVLGLGAGFAELGVRAEGASSVVGRSLRWMDEAVNGSGDGLEALMRITGKTGDQLKAAFAEDKVKAVLEMTAGISKARDGGETLNSVLEELGLTGDGNARILGLLGERHERLAHLMGVSGEAAEEGSAHFKEQAAAMTSLMSGFEMLANRADRLKVSFGEAFSDDLARAMDGTLKDTDSQAAAFAQMGDGLADLILDLATFLDSFSGIGDIFSQATGGLGIFETALILVQNTLGVVTIAINHQVAGIAGMAESWNRFFGLNTKADEWAEISEKALARTGTAMDNISERTEQMAGRSSRAWADLRDAYKDNKGALDSLDEEQRKAIETTLNQTGYVENMDDVYRQMGRTLQRAGLAQRMVAESTKEENKLLETSVRMLEAQGKSREEAEQIAAQNAQKRTAARSQEEENKLIEATIENLIGLGATREEAEAKAREAAAKRTAAAALEEENRLIEENIQFLVSQGYAREEAEKKAAEAAKASLAGMGASIVKFKEAQEAIASIGETSVAQMIAAKERLTELYHMGGATFVEFTTGVEKADKAIADLNEKSLKELDISLEQLSGELSKTEKAAISAFENLLEVGGRSTKDVGIFIDSLHGKLKDRKAYDEAKRIAEEWAITQTGSTEAVAEKLKELEATITDTFSTMRAEIEKTADSAALNTLAANIEKAFKDGDISLEQYIDLLGDVSNKHIALQIELEKTATATKKVGEASKEAAEAAKEVAEDTTGAARAMGGAIAGMINATSQRLAGMSQAAASYWQSLRGQASSATDEVGVMLNRIQEMDRILSHNRLAGNADIGGWGSYFAKEAQHAFQAEKAFLKQKIALEKLLREYEQGTISAHEFKKSTEELERQFNLLDKQDLGALKSAVRSVQNQVDSLTNSLQDTVQSLKQELAGLMGDTEQVEQLRQAERRLELEQKLSEARASGNAEAVKAGTEALSLLDKTHQIRMAQLKEQQDAERDARNEDIVRDEKARQQQEADKREQSAKDLANQQTNSRVTTKMVTVKFVTEQGQTIQGQFAENDHEAFLKELERLGKISR